MLDQEAMPKFFTDYDPSMGLVHQVLTITPYMCRYWMKHHNKSNRPLRPSAIEAYSRDIAGANWDLNGEPFIFTLNKNMVSGQHRALACIKAGIPFESLVVIGVKETSTRSVDSGLVRNPKDYLAMRGMSNGIVIQGAGRLLYSLKHQSKLARSKISNKQVLDLILDKHTKLAESAKVVGAVQKKIGQGTVVCAWHYLATEIAKQNDDALFALDVLETGIPQFRGDPLHAFREKVLTSIKPRDRDDYFFTLIHCWNMFLRREHVKGPKNLKWREFPVEMEGVDYTKDL